MSRWPAVRLEDCAEIVSGATPSTSESAYWNGDICWATPKDLSGLDGAYISDTPRKITRDGLQSCAATILPPQSVLFSSRAPIGHVAINTVPMATNQGFKSFVPKRGRIDAKFLYHWLRYNRPYLERLGNGATFKEVSKAVVARIEIPLPTLYEQRQIAEVLDKVDALQAKRRAATDKLHELTDAVFFDLFGDPFEQKNNSLPLTEIATIIMGQSPNGSSYNFTGVGFPLLNGPTEFGERYPTEKQWTTRPTRLCKAGDILICVRGATAGRLNRADKVYCLGRGLAAIRPIANTNSHADFLFAVLNRYYSYFQARGVGSTFINISREDIEALPIPRPSKDEVGLLVKRLASIEALQTVSMKSSNLLTSLSASLRDRTLGGGYNLPSPDTFLRTV